MIKGFAREFAFLSVSTHTRLYLLVTGMPDDTTILAVHVVGRDSEDTMDHPNM